jgi:hypothetical protein
LIVTTTATGAPVQPAAVGVILYVTVCATVDVFVIVCAIVAPEPAAAPVVDPEVVIVHAKVVPGKLLVSAIEVASPEQIVDDAGVAVTTGLGFTVITTVIGAPAHPPAVGVIV